MPNKQSAVNRIEKIKKLTEKIARNLLEPKTQKMQKSNYIHQSLTITGVYVMYSAGRTNFLNTQKTNKKPGVCL